MPPRYPRDLPFGEQASSRHAAAPTAHRATALVRPRTADGDDTDASGRHRRTGAWQPAHRAAATALQRAVAPLLTTAALVGVGAFGLLSGANGPDRTDPAAGAAPAPTLTVQRVAADSASRSLLHRSPELRAPLPSAPLPSASPTPTPPPSPTPPPPSPTPSPSKTAAPKPTKAPAPPPPPKPAPKPTKAPPPKPAPRPTKHVVKPVAGLNQRQMDNAAAIVKKAQAMGLPKRAMVIGVATAMQESTLYNLASYAVPESLNYPHQGTGADHDSVGLFQQRASGSWGSVQEIMTPSYSAGAFFAVLQNIGGWQNMPLTQAAQSVQISAYPYAYAKHEDNATEIVNALLG